MEDELDEISRGEKQRIPLMRKFWDTFSKQVEEKEKTVSRDEAIQSRTLGADPKSRKTPVGSNGKIWRMCPDRYP